MSSIYFAFVSLRCVCVCVCVYVCSRVKIQQENVFGAFAAIYNLSTMHFVMIYDRDCIAITVFIDLTVVMIMTKTMVTIFRCKSRKIKEDLLYSNYIFKLLIYIYFNKKAILSDILY